MESRKNAVVFTVMLEAPFRFSFIDVSTEMMQGLNRREAFVFIHGQSPWPYGPGEQALGLGYIDGPEVGDTDDVGGSYDFDALGTELEEQLKAEFKKWRGEEKRPWASFVAKSWWRSLKNKLGG